MAETDGSVPRILVLDDDREMRAMLSIYFEAQQMTASAVSARTDFSRQFAQHEPDIILLDLRLEKEDGLDVLRDLRSRSDVPIIIMTGHRRDEIDRVVGLELGADDYITKPFGLRELLARIRSVLRRHEHKQLAAEREAVSGGYRFEGWHLDRRSRRLHDPAGAIIQLTKGEYALLVAFLDAPGRPLSREQLLQATRMHEDVYDRSIDVQVLRLRRKLERDPSTPRAIRTERGFGYVFALPVQAV